MTAERREEGQELPSCPPPHLTPAHSLSSGLFCSPLYGVPGSILHIRTPRWVMKPALWVATMHVFPVLKLYSLYNHQ